jgi:hypothetical protein
MGRQLNLAAPRVRPRSGAGRLHLAMADGQRRPGHHKRSGGVSDD